jgi:hypothetical protein
VNIGVFEEKNSFEWSSPSFAILKKNGTSTTRVVTDFRKLNLLLKCQTFPIPKIGKTDMIRSVEGFTFASALDLNMGYYHIKLDIDAQKICTIVFPRHIEIQIQALIQGYQDFLVPDVFQNVTSKLVQDVEFVKTKMLS